MIYLGIALVGFVAGYKWGWACGLTFTIGMILYITGKTA